MKEVPTIKQGTYERRLEDNQDPAQDSSRQDVLRKVYYDSQKTDVKYLIQQKCEDLLHYHTVLSNQAKSDTYLEARKNQLSGNLGGYAIDSASTVNIFVGNELLKKKGSNPQKSAANDDGNRDYSDDYDSEYADSDYSDCDYSDNSDGDINADVEYTHDEESYETVEDEISIRPSGVDTDEENEPFTDEENEPFEETPFFFNARKEYYKAKKEYYQAKAKKNKESVTSKTNNDC